MLILAAIVLVMMMLLIQVTLVQILYMDSVRLRRRDLPFLELFREQISERIGLKVDDGILTFSIVKHSLLVLLGVSFAFIATDGEPGIGYWFEAAALGWAAMLVSSYIIPQMLNRKTTGHWFIAHVPAVRALAFIVRPLTAVLGFLQSLTQLGLNEDSAKEMVTPEENIDALI